MVYYYIKLKADFFRSPKIKLLQSKPAGVKYTDLLLKLSLEIGLSNGGYLKAANGEDYSFEEMAVIVGYDPDFIEEALGLYHKYGVIRYDGSTPVIIDMEVEQRTPAADRVKKHRESKKDPVKAKVKKEAKIIEGLGVNENIKMSDKELKKIQDKWCNTWESKIDNLSTYLSNKPGKKYVSHYRTILTWYKDDKDDVKQRVVDEDDDPLRFEK